MIFDITGIELTPGNKGEERLGNGKHKDKGGQPIECCCDECNYMMCCLETHNMHSCSTCKDKLCPHAKLE